MELFSILLLIAACISITWSSEVIDFEKEVNKRTYRERCPKEVNVCFRKASTPRKRRYCVLHFAKCIQSGLAADSFQALRREYKAALNFFQILRRDVDWW
ncbi:hypothetical protein ScPMuIL_016937 [Solemya velum]